MPFFVPIRRTDVSARERIPTEMPPRPAMAIVASSPGFPSASRWLIA